MTPWLLLIIAALIVVSVSLYSHARQAESQTLGRQLLVADELKEAEAALRSAVEKLRQMDTVLAVREQTLAREAIVPLAVSSSRAPEPSGRAAPGDDRITGTDSAEPGHPGPEARGGGPDERGRSIQVHEDGDRDRVGTAAYGWPPQRTPMKSEDLSGRQWQARAIELTAAGWTASRIARELELPVGEVELVLALNTSRPRYH